MSRRDELIAFAVLGGLIVVAVAVLLQESPSANVYFPKCPFYFLTGLQCPGCGSTRSVYYLLHGQILTAFRYQPLLVAMLPILFLLLGRRLYELFRDVSLPLPFELQFYRLIAIVICLFFVLRNIPLNCFEWLRPPLS